MAGKTKGAAVTILKEYLDALYIHCNSHVLNIAFVKACDIPAVRNRIGIMTELCIFFKYSPKRQAALVAAIQEMCPDSTRMKLVDLCKTLWIARHGALDVFSQLYPAVVDTLSEISEARCATWNHESSSKAKSLLNTSA